MAYQQRCIVCKKTMVLITGFRQRPVCVECELKDINEPIDAPKWRKFFDIDPALYRKSSFLRSIKRNYLRQGMLSDKQREMFLKVVSEGAEGKPPAKAGKRRKKADEQKVDELGFPIPDDTITL